MQGATEEALVGCNLLRDFIIQEDHARLAASLTSCVKSQRDIVGIEFGYRSEGGGRQNWLIANLYPSNESYPKGATVVAQVSHCY